ncbi:hypothetical protein BDF20DRAFT_798166, partial [Mycotypha africana]|uniref:uncharacterized protein n=1 Tax=Mycotypha africana TaxID=64632 RepID=UPI0023016B1A
EDYENELSYFTHYDQEMEEAVQEADNDDYGYNYGYNYGYDDNHLMDDSLLKLIVDVQSYLVDASKDSPLLALQYKMYTYLKQRALEV